MEQDPGQTRDLSRRGLSVLPELADLLERYWAGEARSLRWPADKEEPAPPAPELVQTAPASPAPPG